MNQDEHGAGPSPVRLSGAADLAFGSVVDVGAGAVVGPVEGVSLLLLSGGMDSAALAYAMRPTYTLFVGYGQRSAVAESRAARAIANEVGLQHAEVTVDLSAVGAGLLHDSAERPGWPSPEWWPFRNQFLVTIAAAWLVGVVDVNEDDSSGSCPTVLTGTVSGDGFRHRDGTQDFYAALDGLLRYQEGGFRVMAPALEMSTEHLINGSGVTDAVLGWTHSCHTSSFPCGACPGCYKRARVVNELGRLQ